jgi:serine/threonine protein phosphatase PrpC
VAAVTEMGIDVSWLSQAGKRTKDNRDCGGVGIRAEEVLCVVLDGSTNGPNSGEFARQITQELIDWYVASDEAMTAETLTARLRQIHEALAKAYPRDSASYMIVNIRANAALALYAGDCLLGRHDRKSGVEWLSRPHTLASVTGETSIASIADLPARHLLTRSFRAREFLLPEAILTKVEGEFLIATDGFWAELSPSEQVRFMDGQNMPMAAEGDDRSVLQFHFTDSEQNAKISVQPDNFYVRAS